MANNKILSGFAVLLLALALIASVASVEATRNNHNTYNNFRDNDKYTCSGGGHTPVTICHKPGTPAQHTLTVDSNAVPAHLAHGDTLGACPAFCGDGKVNQEGEQCDRRAGVPRGYVCTDTCQLEKKRTCEDACTQALADGKIVGSIDSEGHATVTNNGNKAYDISLVSYNMYAALIDDQTLFDSQTKQVKAGKTVAFDVDVPACGYQIDLVCGKPIKDKAPYYGGRVIDFSFENQDNYCTLAPGSSGDDVSVDLTRKAYPVSNIDYVFVCNATGFTPTAYDWYFGDGQILYNSTQGDVFHSYPYPDQHEFIVACKARDDSGHWGADTMSIFNIE